MSHIGDVVKYNVIGAVKHGPKDVTVVNGLSGYLYALLLLFKELQIIKPDYTRSKE